MDDGVPLGIYGGYFGAAQGILLLGLLGIVFTDDLQRINAVKNVLACVVNAVAAVVFIIATHVDWTVAALIAAGSIIGGQIGARAAPPAPLGPAHHHRLRRRRGPGPPARLTRAVTR